MINRVISGSALMLVVILGIYSYLQDLQTEKQMKNFINRGPRFTAEDGQKLCERVAELEKHSIGFQRSGIVQPPCSYYLTSPNH